MFYNNKPTFSYKKIIINLYLDTIIIILNNFKKVNWLRNQIGIYTLAAIRWQKKHNLKYALRIHSLSGII